MTEPDESTVPAGDAESQPMGELAGTVLAGRYRLLKLLGEGAMGAVYVGEHLRIGRHDAIKVLRKGLTADTESIARFNRGARNLSAIRHPNVCTLYDYGETADGAPFLALELVTGESLKDLVEREQALDAPRALAIALQTAQALDAAHHAGIVHRDLKPANIMLETGRDGGDVVKVVDFDIAKGPEPEGGDEVTRLGYVVGTPEYMSPEQLTGEKLDGRSDIYSLGVTLFRMLTGMLPFRAKDVQNIMLERLTERPLTLADARPDLAFPDEVQHVLDRALARDRGERYPRAADMVRDLTALRQTVTTAAPVAERREREVPETRVGPTSGTRTAASGVAAPPKRKAAWLIAVGVVVVAAAGVTALIALNGGGNAAPNDGSGGQTGPVVIDSSQLAAVDDTLDPVGGEGPGERGRGSGDTPPVDPDTGQRGSRGQTNPQPLEPQPPEPQPSSRFTTDLAGEVLFGLFVQMPTDDLDNPADLPFMRAARDTATQFWDRVPMTRRDSATAANIIGSAALAEGNSAECVRWLQRAASLGDSGAPALLALCNRNDG